jgi:hypothetical protein
MSTHSVAAHYARVIRGGLSGGNNRADLATIFPQAPGARNASTGDLGVDFREIARGDR